jgi:hypothetical protein
VAATIGRQTETECQARALADAAPEQLFGGRVALNDRKGVLAVGIGEWKAAGSGLES